MGKEIIVDSGNFENEILKSDKPVLVDFWAEWCGPCRMVAPILEELSEEYFGKIKVCKCNVDDNQELSAKYGVSSIPTFIIFDAGKELSRHTGASSKEKIISFFSGKI